MFTDDEKEIICSEEKCKTLTPHTLNKRFQNIRDKAADAIEELLLLADKRPEHFAQVIGFTRSGRRMPKTKMRNRKTFEPIESKTHIKRIKRGQCALWLATILAINTGVISRWLYQEELRELEKKLDEKQKITKTVDLQKWEKMFPQILIGMLQNQYICPKCGKAGLIFRGNEDWLWMHHNHEDKNPEATFCNVGKTLPSKFVEFPLKIVPQNSGFWIELAELGPGENYRFFT